MKQELKDKLPSWAKVLDESQDYVAITDSREGLGRWTVEHYQSIKDAGLKMQLVIGDVIICEK